MTIAVDLGRKATKQTNKNNSYITFICTNHETCSCYTIHTSPLSVQTMKPAAITQFIHCLYLYKPSNLQLLHNSYITFICTNHESSSYYTILTLPLSVQTMKPAVITQFIHFLYLYKPLNQQLLHNLYIAFICTNHQTCSYYTIHTSPLSVQTIKPAAITQFIHHLYLYKP